MLKPLKIAIFCASSSKVDSKYLNAAEEIAEKIKEMGHSILYGGGHVGLMGRIADTALARDIDITGVIPHFMVKMKWVHQKVSKVIAVDTMFDRKKILIESADVILALPGGIGTLDELLEAITLKQLGQHNKPILIFNVDQFYNPLINMLDAMIEGNFMRKEHRSLWKIIESSDELADHIELNESDDHDYINLAQI